MLSTYKFFLEIDTSRRNFLRKALFTGASAAAIPAMHVAKQLDYSNGIKPSKIQQLNYDADRVERLTRSDKIQKLDPNIRKVNRAADWLRKVTSPFVKSQKAFVDNASGTRRDFLKAASTFGPEIVGASGTAGIATNNIRRVVKMVNPLPTSFIKTPGLNPTGAMKFFGFEGS